MVFLDNRCYFSTLGISIIRNVYYLSDFLLLQPFFQVYRATAIMAHPLLNLNEEQLQVFLPEAKEAGLDAIETHYSKFDDSMTTVLVSLAERFGLKQSGGSDFHGTTKPDIELGTGRGNLFVSHSFYEDLLTCANQN